MTGSRNQCKLSLGKWEEGRKRGEFISALIITYDFITNDVTKIK